MLTQPFGADVPDVPSQAEDLRESLHRDGHLMVSRGLVGEHRTRMALVRQSWYNYTLLPVFSSTAQTAVQSEMYTIHSCVLNGTLRGDQALINSALRL